MADEVQLGTAVPGLDRVLRGGLRTGGLHLVVGDPGAGKTVLAHQIGACHAAAGRPVLYLTALVESHQTLLSQARSFGFFNPAIVPGAFYYASLAPALEAAACRACGRRSRAWSCRDSPPSSSSTDSTH
jgi:circadian clock protein KaiC